MTYAIVLRIDNQRATGRKPPHAAMRIKSKAYLEQPPMVDVDADEAADRDAAIMVAYEHLFAAILYRAARTVKLGGRSAGEAAQFLAMITGRPEAEITRRLRRKR